MSELDEALARAAGWQQPLADEAAPAGPDLEQHNDFLALTLAAAGKPASQFGAAVAPDWTTVRSSAEKLLDQSRDLRLAVLWLRAMLHLHGWQALPAGLDLIGGLLQNLWDHVHPLPDEDGDTYARVNTLTELRELRGLLGDLRDTAVMRDRRVGELLGRQLELAVGLAKPTESETVPERDALARMLAAAVQTTPALADTARAAVEQVARVQQLATERLGSDAPDLKPLRVLVQAAAALMPAPSTDNDTDGQAADADGSLPGATSARALAGAVNSRADALRAIDMVCDYLEKAEPSNPAPLFLRRAQQLLSHNFLQLMKELAPGAMPDLARIVGVDPDSVHGPESA